MQWLYSSRHGRCPRMFSQFIPPGIGKQGYIDIRPLLRICWSLTTTLSMYVVSLTSVSAADSPKSLFPLSKRRNSRNWQVSTHEIGEWQLSNELPTLEIGKFQGKKQILEPVLQCLSVNGIEEIWLTDHAMLEDGSIVCMSALSW